MFLNAKLSSNLCEETLLVVCHIYNKVSFKKTHVSPYETWNNGIKANLNYFKVCWCIAFYKVINPHKSKLGPRAIRSVFVGYAQNSKAYRHLDLDSNVIVEYIHVEFFEDKFIYDSIVHEVKKRKEMIKT